MSLVTYEQVVALVTPRNARESELYQITVSGEMPKNRPRLSESELDLIFKWIEDGAPRGGSTSAVTPTATPAIVPTATPVVVPSATPIVIVPTPTATPDVAPSATPIVINPGLTPSPSATPASTPQLSATPQVSATPGPIPSATPIIIVPPVVPTYGVIFKAIIEPKCLKCHTAASPRAGVDLSTYESTVDSGLVVKGEPLSSALYEVIENGSMPKRAPRLSNEEVEAVFMWIKAGAKND